MATNSMPMTAFCTNCGALFGAETRFCTGCGALREEDQAAASAAGVGEEVAAVRRAPAWPVRGRRPPETAMAAVRGPARSKAAKRPPMSDLAPWARANTMKAKS